MESRLQGAVGPGARLGGLRIVPLLLRAEVEDLRLQGSGWTLDVPGGRVTLAPGALAGLVRLRSLALESPVLQLVSEDDAEPTAAPPDLPVVPVEVESLEIRDATVSWRDAAGSELVLQEVGVSGSIGSGALALEVPGGEWRGARATPFGPVEARLAVSRDLDVTLEHLDAAAAGAHLTARGPLVRRRALALDVDLDGRLSLGQLPELLARPELDGVLDVTGRLEGSWDSLHLALEGRGAAQWDEWPLEGMVVRLDAEPRTPRGQVRIEATSFGATLEGEASLEADTTTGQLRARGVDTSRLPGPLRPEVHVTDGRLALSWEGPVAGPLQVDLEVRGQGRTDGARGSLEGRARGRVGPGDGADLEWTLRARGEASKPLPVSLRLRSRGRLRGTWPPTVTGDLSGDFRLVDAADDVQTPFRGTFLSEGSRLRLEVHAEGAWPFDGQVDLRGSRIVALALDAEEIDLARFAAEASGQAALLVRASGPLRRPEVTARVSVTDLGWGGARLGRLELGVEGTAEQAEWRGALPDLSIGGEGELRSDPGQWVRGQVELHETPLGRLGPLLGLVEPIDGTLSATVGFALPLERPVEAEVTLEVASLEAVYRDRPLVVRPFRASLRDSRVSVRDVRVEGAGVSLDVMNAHAGLGKDDPLELRAWLDADLDVLPIPPEWAVSGTVGGALGVRGSVSQPRFEGALLLSALSVKGPSLPEVHVDTADLYLGDEGLRLPRVEARVGTGRATLEGEIPWAALLPSLRGEASSTGERAHLRASWEGVELEPLQGGLAGEVTVDGGLASLEELQAELRLPARTFVVEGVTLEVEPATLQLANGRLTTDGLTVRTSHGELVVTGGADLVAQDLDLRGRGGVALDVLSPFLEAASIGGAARVDLTLTGPLAAPVPGGSLVVKDASVRVRPFPQALTGLNGRVDLHGDTATLQARGDLGGGSLDLEGEVSAVGLALGDSWLQLTGRNVSFRYPPGLRSRFDVDLTLAGRPGDFALVGDVAVLGGVYALDSAVREALRAPGAVGSSSERLRDVALDVTVNLARPVAVQSAFGRLEATGRVNARGDLQAPAPFGRLDVRRGGRIELQGRELTVTSGALSFSGTWNPDLSLNGETVVPDVPFGDEADPRYSWTRDVRVQASLQGSLEQPSLELSSDPALSQQEIFSVIATGRRGSSLVDSSAWLLGAQTATLVADPLTRRVAQSFGLDQIIVRPDLVARDTDPSARFTFGKRIGRSLGLVYSAGLGGPETRYAELRVYPGQNVQLRGLRRDTGAHELGAGQRFEFGAPPDEPSDASGVRLEDVRFEGPSLDPSLQREVRLSPGRRVADWRVQQEAERLRDRLRRGGHLDAEVSARLDGDVAVFRVEPGPVYGWRVDGMSDPPDLSGAFARALFEADAIDRGRARIRSVLESRGYLRGEVQATTREQEGGRREITFEVTPGARFEPVTVRFPGASALSRQALLTAAGGPSGLLQAPESAVRGLQDAYRERRHLAARIGAPEVEQEGTALTLTVAIEEGPAARLLWVRAEGNTIAEAELLEALSIPTGVVFSSEVVTEAVSRVRSVYFSRGYTDVRVRPRLVVEGRDVGLLLQVREGQPHVVRSVSVRGNTRTRGWIVQRALDLEEGEPLDPRALAHAERRLVELGTFSRSAIVPAPEEPGVLNVDLEEAADFAVGYDVRWDDESGWSGLVDGVARNVLGLGVAVGGRARYGADLREYRGSLNLPSVLTGGDVTGSVFRTVEEIPADEPLRRVQTGFQIQQSLGRLSRLQVLLGYRFRRNLTLVPSLPEIPIDVAGLDISLLRTTQDDLLDARRGDFFSLNLDVAPSLLGSDAPLFKSYAQVVLNRPFEGGAFTWAQSYRLGLAFGLEGEPVISTERFRAGGAGSLRGFDTNEVGPRFLGGPAGGEAVVIMNQELRYHHHSGLGLVGFYDVGNVFETVEAMSFDLRHTLGAGVRWASPVGLLRLDVGFPLDPEPDEKGYQIFFGIGQAF